MIQPNLTLGSKLRSTERGLQVERVIGRHDSGLDGPLIVVVGGLHGNEPAGVHAAFQVLETLQLERITVRGRVVALAGNRAALAERERFLARDLNRVWCDAEIGALRRRDPAHDDPEGREQRELLQALESEVDAWDGPLNLLDLHTTSAGGAPFCLAADTLQNRALAGCLPLPMVMGLEEGIEGPLLSWLADRGHPALVVEGGRHEGPQTEAQLAAAVWIYLAAAGALDSDQAQVVAAHEFLQEAASGPPGVFEIVHKHPVATGDAYRMLPEFDNFQPIDIGQPLANDRHGLIRSPCRGLMLMPLYQDQGSDGYFLCTEISRAWLRFSERCRRSGLETLLPSLPGVKLDHTRPRTLLVNEDAPEMVRRVLRHFGYRRPVQAPAGSYGLQRRPERSER